MPASVLSPRTAAAAVVVAVLRQGRSLSQAISEQSGRCAVEERALVQELAYGALRWRHRLEALLAQLLKHPLKSKDEDIKALLLIGLYQLGYTQIAPHAAVHTTVEAVRASGKSWAVALANAVLRRYQRERDRLEAALSGDPQAQYAHPAWLLERLRQDWPQQWQSILDANNARPPFVLRVNARHNDRQAYQALLTARGMHSHTLALAPQALVLEQPVPVAQLPGFAEGAVSVQDSAAQLAAGLLDARPGMRVLDACAAPGGKTAHLLECHAQIEVVAVDNEAQRAARITETLERLQLQAQVAMGDAREPAAWWDGRPFDRILLDAPCSATGVIRRHPDIKSLRRADDIPALAATQATLLDAVWPLLAPGGMLLYVTCSILRQENEEQIAGFLQRHPDAREANLDNCAAQGDWGVACRHGRQLLPGMSDASWPEVGPDGFYYARLVKQPL